MATRAHAAAADMCRAAPPTADPAEFTHKIVRDLHWVLTSPQYGQMVERVMRYLRRSDYRGQPLYRQNFAPGCGSALNHSGMFHDLHTSRSPDPTHTVPPDVWQWRQLSEFDAWWSAAAAREATAAASGGGTAEAARPLKVLNVSRATGYRVDGHCGDCQHPADADCLHYCLPGAIDLWSVALQEVVGVGPSFFD